MNRFSDCLKFVLDHEGGKSDDPLDRGGRTAYGVTQRTYDGYRMGKGLPVKDVWEITQEETRDIYIKQYWSPINGSALPVGLDLCVFDWAVNGGARRAVKWLQQVIGMDAIDCDGIMGQRTMTYMNDVILAGRIDSAIATYQEKRQKHYSALVEKDPSQSRFIKGWTRRCKECLEAAMEARA